MQVKNKILYTDTYFKIGNFLEYLDFSIFALASPMIIETILGIKHDISKVLFGNILFAITYFMRPIGGLYFGSISDKKGRGIVLINTVFLMGICSLGLAFLPGFEKMGYISLILLLIFRGIQCFVLGAEFNNGLVYIYETSDKSHLSVRIGFFIGSGTLGWFIGTTMIYLFSSYNYMFDDKDLMWRIPFLISAILSITFFTLRNRFLSSKNTRYYQAESKPNSANKDSVIKNIHKYLAVLIFGGWNGSLFYGLFIFPVSFKALIMGSSLDNFLSYSYMCIGFYMMCLVFTGIIIDKIRNKILLRNLSAILVPPSVLIIFYMINNNSYIPLIAFSCALITAQIMNLTSGIIPGLFQVDKRAKLSSFFYNLGISVFGATTPFICTYLYSQFSQLAPFIYITFLSVIGAFFLTRIEG